MILQEHKKLSISLIYVNAHDIWCRYTKRPCRRIALLFGDRKFFAYFPTESRAHTQQFAWNFAGNSRSNRVSLQLKLKLKHALTFRNRLTTVETHFLPLYLALEIEIDTVTGAVVRLRVLPSYIEWINCLCHTTPRVRRARVTRAINVNRAGRMNRNSYRSSREARSSAVTTVKLQEPRDLLWNLRWNVNKVAIVSNCELMSRSCDEFKCWEDSEMRFSLSGRMQSESVFLTFLFLSSINQCESINFRIDVGYLIFNQFSIINRALEIFKKYWDLSGNERSTV